MVSRQRLDQPGAITGIARRLRSAERSAGLGFSSITRGGMRVESADGLLVNTVAGGLPGLRVTGLEVVDGTLRITGTIEGSGTFTWTGTLNQSGPTNLRGPVAITGETGTLTVDAETLLRGLTRLLADLQVEAGGEIIVQGSQPIRLGQVGGLARIDLGATAQIWSGGDGVTILGVGGGFINVYSDGVDIGGAGKRTRISNTFEVSSLNTTPPGATVLPMYWDPVSKRVYAG